MPNAISNTSPLLYLHRIDALQWLPQLFDEVWTPTAVVAELQEGLRCGYHVPNPHDFPWLKIVAPQHTPAEWFALDLGAEEIAAMALALENPSRVVILDDALARHVAHAASLEVWGTLRVLLEAKAQGLISEIAPYVEQLRLSGMWISDKVQIRILRLADE